MVSNQLYLCNIKNIWFLEKMTSFRRLSHLIFLKLSFEVYIPFQYCPLRCMRIQKMCFSINFQHSPFLGISCSVLLISFFPALKERATFLLKFFKVCSGWGVNLGPFTSFIFIFSVFTAELQQLPFLLRQQAHMVQKRTTKIGRVNATEALIVVETGFFNFD